MPKVIKMGRPSLPKKKRLSKVYAVRFRPEDERKIERAIKASGQPQADWIRAALLDAAKKEKILSSLR